MYRVDPLAELITQQLQQEDPVFGDPGAVHEKPGGLVDGDEIPVPEQYRKGFDISPAGVLFSHLPSCGVCVHDVPVTP